MLLVQGNLASSYQRLGRLDEALCIRRDIYDGYVKLKGKEGDRTLSAAINYASTLMDLGDRGDLKRFKEAKALMCKTMPVARRVYGESHENMLMMRWLFTEALYKADGGTLGHLREAVTTFEEIERTARRVLGGAHPTTKGIERALQEARATFARASLAK